MATAKLAEAPLGAMMPRPFLVRDREQETADTWTLTLEPVAGQASPVTPGQFMMVYAFGIGEVPISVSRTPDGDGSLGLTLRSVGAVTDAISCCEPGQTLGLRGPFGNGWPVGDPHGGDVLVVAGGIGLAPLRPVVLSMLAGRHDHGTVALLYGARTPADLLYTREFDEWRRQISVETTVDAAEGDWPGRVGVVSKLIAGATIRPESTTAFVCGPEVMMRFTVDALRARGVVPEAIHLSMERHMDCGIGLCGHCQLGPTLVCRDGPVYSVAQLAPLLAVRQL
jgi:anaerobic sulfite reductase subunit B